MMATMAKTHDGTGKSLGEIRYYAVADNEQGQIGQLLITRRGGRQVSQEWTGVIYRSMREACRDLERLNRGCPWTTPAECAMARERAVAGTDTVIPACPVHAQ